MPVPDEERFEAYLKQFCPLAPDPLFGVERGRGTRRWLAFGAWAAAAATVVAAAVLVLYSPPGLPHMPDAPETAKRVEPLPERQPLTLGNANALLANAPSLKDAVDRVAAQAFQSGASRPPEGTQSALEVLSKEKTKL